MENNSLGHYYGDTIRQIFIITGLGMVIALPFFSSILKLPAIISIVAILVLDIVGGWMNPTQLWIMVVDLLASVAGFAMFEYYAIYTYVHLAPAEPKHVVFFWINQAFALLFFLAIYLSVKSIRGKMLARKNQI